MSVQPTTAHTPSYDIAERRRRDGRRALLAGGVAVACGAGVVFVHYLGGRPHGEGDPEGWLASVGFGAPFIAAGLLAVLGTRLDASWLWWAAGVALAPMSIVSIVLFPLLGPAVALIVLGFRNGRSGTRELWGGALAAALIAVFGVIVFHQDPATWETGGSSNVITDAEATLSVAVSVGVLVAGCALATALRQRERAAPRS